jgi:hypothetical protein
MRGAATAVLLAAASVIACAGSRSPERPDDACAATCAERIPRCGATACTRGCQLALDRLVENEGEPVLACVARSSAPCDDWLWAECAARVGPHIDGGPPAPLPGLRH